MPFFFALLPTDLQIDVFQTWLGCCVDDGDLRVVSALDVAVCNKILRPQFLSLATSVGRGCSIRVEIIKGGTFWNAMRWFASRAVDVKFLSVGGGVTPLDENGCEGTTVLRSVSNLFCAVTESADEISTYFSAFPNMKSLEVAFRFEVISTDNFWRKLAIGPLPELQELEWSNHNIISDRLLVCAALQHIGKNLKKLYFVEYALAMKPTLTEWGNQLLQAIAESCHNLQSVQLSVPNGTADKVIAFMLANKELQEVSLFFLKCTGNDVHDILVATEPHLKLKKFRSQMSWLADRPDPQDGETFARILQRFPSIVSLEMLGCHLSFTNRSLDLSSIPCQDMLERILATCSIEVLSTPFDMRGSGYPFSEWVGQRVGTSLTTLSCHFRTCELNAQLIVHCFQLKELTLYYASDELLLLVAQTCKQLRHLMCWGASDTPVTDLGVEALFTNCCLLTEVNLSKSYITFRSLQAILDNKIRLKKFAFVSAHIGVRNIERFKLSAKELQLLPVPQILCE